MGPPTKAGGKSPPRCGGVTIPEPRAAPAKQPCRVLVPALAKRARAALAEAPQGSPQRWLAGTGRLACRLYTVGLMNVAARYRLRCESGAKCSQHGYHFTRPGTQTLLDVLQAVVGEDIEHMGLKTDHRLVFDCRGFQQAPHMHSDPVGHTGLHEASVIRVLDHPVWPMFSSLVKGMIWDAVAASVSDPFAIVL